MAARPIRRAICAGAKKGTAVALAVVALQRLPRYSFALPRFCYKRDLSVRAVLLRALLRLVVFCFAVLLHCARLVAVLPRCVKRRISSRE